MGLFLTEGRSYFWNFLVFQLINDNNSIYVSIKFSIPYKWGHKNISDIF